MDETKKTNTGNAGKEQTNAGAQAVDKAPGEEREKQDKVTPTDLKGKKVDGDPSKKEDQPASNPS